MRFQRAMVGLMLRSRRLSQEAVAADGAHISAFGAENARISEKTDVGAVCRKNIPTIDKGDELALRAEKMLRIHKS